MSDVETERIEVELSPVEVYRRTGASALLERGRRGWRETYVAAAPVASFRYRRGADDGEGFERLRAWLDSVGVGEYDADAGAFGYLGYDLVAELEDLPGETVRDYDLPDAAFDLYDTVLTVRDDAVVIEAVDHDRSERPPGERIREYAAALREPPDREGSTVQAGGDARSPVEAGDDATPVPATDLASNFDREAYERAVETVKERVREGDTFQANVSQRIAFRSPASPLALYAAVRETTPGPYMGLLAYDDCAVVSSSPELLVEKEGRRLRTRPIAGTRPRGEGEGEDADLRAELTTSAKERAEHAILVDLARNDLGAAATHGSVSVDRFTEAVPYAEVQHLESVVTGELRESADLVDAVRSVFPGGTVTGAPKPRTLSIIDAVEPTERGPYTGSMGRIGLDGDATLNILIRTVVGDGDRYYLQVGGGVVHDSDPAAEYEETLHKAEGVLNALAVEDGSRIDGGIRVGNGTDDGGGGTRSDDDRGGTRSDDDRGGTRSGDGDRTRGADAPARDRSGDDGAPGCQGASGPVVTGAGGRIADGRGGGESAVRGATNRNDPVDIAVVDNHDSFANNVEQYVGEFARVEVDRYRSVPDADGIVFSPGPGRPAEFPVMYDVLDRADVPVLGVCLGHQAIADGFGGEVGYAGQVVHGKQSDVRHDATGVFAGLPSPMPVGRYHSLVVSAVPDELVVTARGAGEVMGIAHPERPVYGVQFHPESILTPAGKGLVRNFARIVERHRRGEWEPADDLGAGVDPGTRGIGPGGDRE